MMSYGKKTYQITVKQLFNAGAYSPVVESWTWEVRAPAGHKVEEGNEYLEDEARKAAQNSANLHYAQNHADYYKYEYDPGADPSVRAE